MNVVQGLINLAIKVRECAFLTASLLLACLLVEKGNLLVEVTPNEGCLGVFLAAFVFIVHLCGDSRFFLWFFPSVPRPLVDFALAQAELLGQLRRLIPLKDPISVVSTLEHPVLLHSQARVWAQLLVQALIVVMFVALL